MLPPTKVENPLPLKISPVSVVVVVLPLVPVIATIGAEMNMLASSISLMISRRCERARRRGLISIGTPGLTTMRSTIRKLYLS